ncbi:hypothetical protein J4414_00790 [Candidatus Woesearchaeota archaeon]|nr:hypothetical protein [Candidatus Woesearchaeota archaeon]
MGVNYLNYYSRKEIQKAFVDCSENREVSVMFGVNSFGKRPDILQFEDDVFELAKKGATSFHYSVEQWSDPLQLKSGMSQKELEDLRTGWSLILDLDTKFLDYAKEAALLLVEALKFHDVKNISLKYSGSNGFHIGIPSKAFPESVDNKKTKLLFPEGTRVISSYLKDMIKPYLSDKLLSLNSLKEISEFTNKSREELIKNGKFDPYSVIEVDSALTSSRHMIRMPYSMNEKKGLVSLPITENELKNFKISRAIPKNVEYNLKFLDDSKINDLEASNLIIQAFDWYARQKKQEIPKLDIKRKFELPTIAIKDEKYFPECIKSILKGVETDGRKRAIFILINFFRNLGWTMEDIEKYLLDWNEKNYEPLRKGYIQAQMHWHKRNIKPILPPNCSNEMYYSGLGIKCQENICSKVKNPVNYTLRLVRQKNQGKKKR